VAARVRIPFGLPFGTFFFLNNEIHKWILIPYYGELALDGVPVRSTTENGEILNEDGF
jgi:hypothetical protein